MSRSSISNSKTLKSIPTLTRAGFFAIVLFFATRIGLYANPDPLYPLAKDSFQSGQMFMESKFRSDPESPRLLLLGTSRLMWISPAWITRQLNLEQDAGHNGSTAGANFFRIHSFLSRNPDVLTNLDVLVIDLVPAQLYSTVWSDEGGAGFLLYGSFEEKIRSRGIRGKILVIADTIVPFRSNRFAPHEWRIGLFGTHEEKLTFNNYQLQAWVRDLMEGLGRLESRDMVNRVLEQEFPPPVPFPVQEFALNEIVDMLSPDTAVLLIRWPYRDDAQEIIDSTEELHASDQAYRKYAESIARERRNVQVEWYDHASDMGLVFKDYNSDGAHFSKSGLRKAANEIAAIIRKEGWLQKD